MVANADMTALTFGEGHPEWVSSISPSSLTSSRATITFDADKVMASTLSDYILTFQFLAIPGTQQEAFLRMIECFVDVGILQTLKEIGVKGEDGKHRPCSKPELPALYKVAFG